MENRILDRTKWKSYFDRLSKKLNDRLGELDISGPLLPEKVTAGLSSFQGISYEPKFDRLEIFMESLDHEITHPQMITLKGEGDIPTCIEIRDSDKNLHQLDLRIDREEAKLEKAG